MHEYELTILIWHKEVQSLVIASQVIIVGVGCVGGVPLERPVGRAAGRHYVVEGLLQQWARGGGRGRAPGARVVHPAQPRP